SMVLVDRALRMRSLRHNAVLLWNANNVFGNWRIDWPTMEVATTITTVSRYMKFLLWREGVNPVVIPNGIPREAMTPPSPRDVVTLRDGGAGDLFLFKIGRFDPDKRWVMAVTAAARLKKQGVRVRMLIRAGRVAITGSTGEDYAEPFRNALVLETDDPAELVACLNLLRTDQRVGPRLRREGKNTARAYLWDQVIAQLHARLELAAARQGVAWEGPTSLA